MTTSPASQPQGALTDSFRGDDDALIGSITALIELDREGALVPHGLGGHARKMLEAAACRLSARPATAAAGVPRDEALTYNAVFTRRVGHKVYDWKTVDAIESAAFLRGRAAGISFAALAAQTATQPASEAWPKLDKPARVVGTFGVGVSSRLVVEAAQRYFESTAAERAKTPQQRREDEIRRRVGWDLLNGYADVEGATSSQAALAALRYWRDECSGAEPSLSVFERMVDAALAAQPAPAPGAGDSQ